MGDATKLPAGETIERIVSYASLLMHFLGKKPEGGKGEVDQLKTTILDSLSRKDESSFMEAMAELGKKDLGGELKNRIIRWMETLKKDTTTWKYAYLFRVFITTNPDKAARINILESYAREENDTARTRRLEQEKTPSWMIELIGKKADQVREYLTSEGLPELRQNMNNLTQTMRAEAARRRNRR